MDDVRVVGVQMSYFHNVALATMEEKEYKGDKKNEHFTPQKSKRIVNFNVDFSEPPPL